MIRRMIGTRNSVTGQVILGAATLVLFAATGPALAAENNVSSVTQTGEAAYALVDQTNGESNQAMVLQDAPSAAYVFQIEGAYSNRAEITQAAGAAGAGARVDQRGGESLASVFQSGADGIVEILQTGGTNSLAEVTQWGEADISLTVQDGSRHTALVTQAGDGAFSLITQGGGGNAAFVNQ